MLGASADGGLSILFCNGPAGVYAQQDGHDHHVHHHGGDHGSGHQTHVTPACSHWSTSGTFVATALIAPVLPVVSPDKDSTILQSAVVQSYLITPRVTRGPPALI